ncbi:MAG: hypothetical protein KKB04_00760 [Candidatus Thermoplasmatota archaeon]|nr:hypothetical protein [Candidatus Thermoplasmatota archaeon]
MGKIEKVTKKIEKIHKGVGKIEEKIEEINKKCDLHKITKAEREKLKRKYVAKADALKGRIRRLERIRLGYEKKMKEKEKEGKLEEGKKKKEEKLKKKKEKKEKRKEQGKLKKEKKRKQGKKERKIK